MERINYIDSLKGIAIITIVWRHIADLGLIGHVNCLFLYVLNSFHVPLFFFLSGIFAFKRLETITTKNIFLFVKDKFFRLYRYCPWMRGMATSQISCNNGIDKKASHVPL